MVGQMGVNSVHRSRMKTVADLRLIPVADPGLQIIEGVNFRFVPAFVINLFSLHLSLFTPSILPLSFISLYFLPISSPYLPHISTPFPPPLLPPPSLGVPPQSSRGPRERCKLRYPMDPNRAQPTNGLWCILSWKSLSPQNTVDTNLYKVGDSIRRFRSLCKSATV